MPYGEMAVFYRTNSQSRALEEIFIRSAVPYKIMGGTKFYERAEIKDAMAYLVAVANPADEMSVRRILNKPRRGIGDVTETSIARFAEEHGLSFRDALAHPGQLGVGPKLQASIAQLDAVLREATEIMLPASGEVAPPTAVAEGLTLLLQKSGYMDALRASRDPQDEARLENLDELIAVTRDFARNNPEGTISDFLTEVALVSDADDLDDESGVVSLMTMHTAKGLEFDAVFVTGVEEDLIPHRISANEPGRPAGGAAPVLRRHHPRPPAPAPLARDDPRPVRRGDGRDAEPVPAGDPGRPHRLAAVAGRCELARRHPVPCAERAAPRRFGGFGGSGDRFAARELPRRDRRLLKPLSTAMDRFPNRVTAKVRDNGDLELNAGDRIRHDDFGEGRVEAITGEGAKRIAHVRFDTAGQKKLLVKIAPIQKI